MRKSQLNSMLDKSVPFCVPKVRSFSLADYLLFIGCLLQHELEQLFDTDPTTLICNLKRSVVIRPNSYTCRRGKFKSLSGRDGWAIFRLLTIEGIPQYQYLISAAVTSGGEWVDGQLMEQLLEFACEAEAIEGVPAEVAARLEVGLDWHRQLSLADWSMKLRQPRIEELEHKIDLQAVNITALEDELRQLKEQLRTEKNGTTRTAAVERRKLLRARLLEAEQCESDLKQRQLAEELGSPGGESIPSTVSDLLVCTWAVQYVEFDGEIKVGKLE